MTAADDMRALLERIWKYNEARAEAIGYQLLVLAVPMHPADIEAISALDRDLMEEVLREYLRKRDAEKSVVHDVESSFGESPAPSGDERSPEPSPREGHPPELGQGPAADRPREVRSDPAPEEAEGLAGAVAVAGGLNAPDGD